MKGFSQEYNQEDNGAMTLDNIEKYMDYSLMPDDGSHPPREALRIARLSGVDSGILDYAKRILEK